MRYGLRYRIRRLRGGPADFAARLSPAAASLHCLFGSLIHPDTGAPWRIDRSFGAPIFGVETIHAFWADSVAIQHLLARRDVVLDRMPAAAIILYLSAVRTYRDQPAYLFGYVGKNAGA